MKAAQADSLDANKQHYEKDLTTLGQEIQELKARLNGMAASEKVSCQINLL